VGDFYIQTTDKDKILYGPKGPDDSWGPGTSMMGRTVLGGPGDPDAKLGLNGDFYIDTENNRIFGPKIDDKWGSGSPLTGTGNVTGVAGGDLLGSFPNPTIKAFAVTGDKIANDAVTRDKLVDGAVTTVKLDNNAVTGDKLAPEAVNLTADKVSGILPVSRGGSGTNALTGIRLAMEAMLPLVPLLLPVLPTVSST
jgi:hypothetical protein